MTRKTSRYIQDLVNLREFLLLGIPNGPYTFGKMLRYGCQVLGLNHADIAEALGVSISTIRRWYSGKNAPHKAMRPIVHMYLRVLTEKAIVTYYVDNIHVPREV